MNQNPLLEGRLTDALPGWKAWRREQPSLVVGVLHGEGIGPEVVDAALVVLKRVAGHAGITLELRTAEEPAGARHDQGLSPSLARFCDAVFAEGGAVFCGAYGGRFVYDLRARFGLYCKVVPLRPSPALADVSIVRPERLTGTDMLVVRENVGGLYFGEAWREGTAVHQRFSYAADEVTQILVVALELARRRRGRLAVIVKTGGIPSVSELWAEQTAALDAGGVAVELVEVDNASFQIVADPARFDVVVAPNLFGDILADAATVLLGSRGMSYSANFGRGGRAVYQTGHGAARDLAGSDRANPVAQILSLALMLRESFALDALAARIENAVERTLSAGFRTADVAGPGHRLLGTRTMAEQIAAEATAS